jgi:hypothetical protein
MSSEVETSLIFGIEASNWEKKHRFLDFARNDKKRMGYPQFLRKMIDNLFNSFTCHAVLGTALGFSTRDQHKPNKFYGGKIDRRES